MIPVIDGEGAIHTARAHGDTVLLHIPARSFLAALDADSRLARGCLLMLCERGRSVYGNLASEALMPLRGRLARHLVMLLDHHRTLPGGGGVDLALQVSQEELAAMLAATRQRLNRELKALESEGIISLAYKRIRVLDRDALRLQAVETLLPSGR
jgi:CRP-like cAMP-binding protein